MLLLDAGTHREAYPKKGNRPGGRRETRPTGAIRPTIKRVTMVQSAERFDGPSEIAELRAAQGATRENTRRI
jgi:hypothetical protein